MADTIDSLVNNELDQAPQGGILQQAALQNQGGTPASMPPGTAGSMYAQYAGTIPLDASQTQSQKDLMDAYKGYAPDPSEKWLNFAANIAKPTKYGTLGEVVSNVAGGLEPIISKENALKNQYKVAAAQLGYQASMKDAPAAKTAMVGLAGQMLQLEQALRQGDITQQFYERAKRVLTGQPVQQAQPQAPSAPVMSVSPDQFSAPVPQDLSNSQPGAAQIGTPTRMAPPQVGPSSAPIPPPSSGNSDFYGLNDGAIVGAALGGPAAISKALIEVNTRKPESLRGVGYIDKNGKYIGLPQGVPAGYTTTTDSQGRIIVVPATGGPEAVVEMKAAETRAQQGETFHKTTIDGREVTVPGKNIPLPGGVVQPSVPSAQPAALTQTPPQDAQNRPPNFNFQGMTKDQIIHLGTNITDPVERKQFLVAAAQAAPQAFADQKAWDNVPITPSITGQGMSAYDEAMQKGRAAHVSALSTSFGTDAENANRRIAVNNQALDLMQKADTGPGAEWMAQAKAIIQKYVPGLPDSYFTNSPENTKALAKQLVDVATEKARERFGGKITQGEVSLLLNKGSPNVDMPKAAIQFLIDSDNAEAKYKLQQASDFGNYIAKGGDPYRFQSWYASNFPMTNALKSAHEGSSMVPSTPKGAIKFGDLK